MGPHARHPMIAEALKSLSTGTSRLSLIPHAALTAHHCGAAAHGKSLALSVTVIAVAEGGHSKSCTSSVLLVGFSLRGEDSPNSSVILDDGSEFFAGGLSGNTVQLTDLL